MPKKEYQLIDEDLLRLKHCVDAWFEPETLDKIFAPTNHETTMIGLDWLTKAGKRWRPFLSVAAYAALQESHVLRYPKELQAISIAVECFHKASLIHDDIEDNDAIRYGEKTLHERYGVPIALNVGDYLLGEGYRLISDAGIEQGKKVKMLSIVANAHRTLSLGQGAELSCFQDSHPLTVPDIIDIFRYKTAPAFNVALSLGAVYAGASDPVLANIHGFSENLGIAFQIQDDLNDLNGTIDSNDSRYMRLSVLLSLAYEQAEISDKLFFDELWKRGTNRDEEYDARLKRFLSASKILSQGEALKASYKTKALSYIDDLTPAKLQILLQRILDKVLDETA